MTCVGITSLAAAWNAILSGSSQTGSVKRVMRRPCWPRYERPNPAEIRFAGSGSREAQSQGSSFKPFLEQDLTFSRWSAKRRHVEGAEIALIARAAKWCHELVGGLGCINNRNRCGAEVRRTSASGWEPSPTRLLR